MGKKKKLATVASLSHGQFFGHTLLAINATPKDILTNCDQPKEWREALKHIPEYLFENSWGVACKREVKGVTYTFLFLHKGFDFSDNDYVRLAHEITHLCQFILPDFLDRNREIECEAYFHSYLMTQVLEVIRENEAG